MIGVVTLSVAFTIRHRRPADTYASNCGGNKNRLTWNNGDPIENTLYQESRLRGTLRAWAEEALRNSGYRPAAHHLYLVSELENLSNGKYDQADDPDASRIRQVYLCVGYFSSLVVYPTSQILYH